MPDNELSGLPLLHPEESVWTAMLTGWRSQQLSRNLAFSTIEQREAKVLKFQKILAVYPWSWTAPMVDEFFMELRSVKLSRHSTLLAYQDALRLFMNYLVDPAYGWQDECLKRFGEFPVQVLHEWNSARHVQEALGGPGKRPYTRHELQTLFDTADEMVATATKSGKKGRLSSFRTAVIMKSAYAWGLRRNEVRSLDLADFGVNHQARVFGEYGVVYVRFGKAMKGSPPKRRSVLTVPQTAWAVDCVQEWIDDIRPEFNSDSTALWPTERGTMLSLSTLSRNFREVRVNAGLDEELDFHSLRRSYITHLIESNLDAFFVQQQVGHEHASTTSLYTGTSPDYRQRVLKDAFAKMAQELKPRDPGPVPGSKNGEPKSEG